VNSKDKNYIYCSWVRILALAVYTTYTLIKIIPIANEFFNVGKDPKEIQTQREDAQKIFNNLLEGNKSNKK
jgi:hypothetical protein